MLADDLGWRDLSCTGSTYFQTPNIDALAAGGMRFTDAYAASPSCSPTRSSILTGCYPARTRITNPGGGSASEILEGQENDRAPRHEKVASATSATRLNLKFKTIAQSMKEAGYATAFFGKWHLGRDPHLPENFGFDTVVGGRHFSGPPFSTYFGPWAKDANMPDVASGAHADDVITTEAVQFIKKQHEAGQPFFIFLWFYSVHGPFESKEELVKKYAALKDPENPQRSPTMAAMIHVLDENVGRVEKALQELGIERDTVVIFTPDNGGNMYNVVDGTTPTNNAPLAQGKGHSREGGVRVPLIVKYPPLVKAGQVSGARVGSPDFYPTVLDLAGLPLEPETHLDGVNFKAALQGRPFDRPAMLTHQPHNMHSSSIYEGNWKLTRFWHHGDDHAHRNELYDLAADAGETRNLAPDHPDVVQRLSRILDTKIESTGALRPRKNLNFEGTAVGSWSGEDGARVSLTAPDILRVEGPAGGLITAHNGPVAREGFFVAFEARSPGGMHLEVLHGRGLGSKREVLPTPGAEAAVDAGGEWQPFKVFVDSSAKVTSVSLRLKSEGAVEIKNIRPLTPDGSPMSAYWYF